jgi:antitoxin (DNA-binding transcriptional repressor) of toxin-antitoxin stability system
VAANGERFLVTSHQKVVAELNPASSTEAADGIPDLLWLTKPTKPLKKNLSTWCLFLLMNNLTKRRSYSESGWLSKRR